MVACFQVLHKKIAERNEMTRNTTYSPNTQGPSAETRAGVPMPIVKLNRWTLLGGILLALVAQAPWITTLLFFMIFAALVGGPRWSLVAQVGKRLFADKLPGAETEDFRLMRFNNTIAATLLGLSQVSFLLGAGVLGWMFSLMVALAAAIALSGFCVGCYLFFHFRMFRFRIFGK